jgi:predicted nuclease with TOPRIM domain
VCDTVVAALSVAEESRRQMAEVRRELENVKSENRRLSELIERYGGNIQSVETRLGALEAANRLSDFFMRFAPDVFSQQPAPLISGEFDYVD